MPGFKQWLVCGGILMLALVSLNLTGCGSSNEIALGAKDDGTQIELERGQILAVTLDSNPTTGYGWARDPAQSDETLILVGEPEYKSNSNLIGGGGTETLRFRANASGTVTLDLIYRRPWEKEVKPAGSFAVEVTVR